MAALNVCLRYLGDSGCELLLLVRLQRRFVRTVSCGCGQAHAKGSSLMQPLRPKAGAPSMAALGSAAFDALARGNVAPDAAFFQKYQVRCGPQPVAGPLHVPVPSR